ncbi:MAG: hypothetical protein IH614_13400 [Desulfuromonadales bacterium]|nr:hypothetical protein [Desulfuromonadales bacterium]
MKKQLLLTLSILLFGGLAHGTPYVSGLAGNFSNDQPVTIHGAGFGAHNLQVEWLGGASGHIETAPAGADFASPGWSFNLDRFKPTYDNSHAYSGTQSIIFDGVNTGDGRFGLTYDPGAPVTFGYVSWMVYIDTGGASGQWKMFRMNWENNVQDTFPEVVLFNWFGSSDTLNIRRSKEDITARHYPGRLPEAGEWVRMELYLQPSSAPGVGDGSVEVWAHRPGQVIEKIADHQNLVTYGPGESRLWRYFVFQNYQGNGLGGRSRVWMDDLYIQGTRARVEIGNAPTWSACTQREVQKPAAWDDSAITLSLNQGTFAAGQQVYLYVVDAAGNVNEQGYPLVLGAAGPVIATAQPL